MNRTRQEILRDDLTDIVREASDAFWARASELMPESTYGDFGPEETMRWQHAATDAVSTWIKNNVPVHPELKEGDRVKFTGTLDRAAFCVEDGEYGIVKELDVTDATELRLVIELERFHRDALEWENCVVFHWDDFGCDDIGEIVKTLLGNYVTKVSGAHA